MCCLSCLLETFQRCLETLRDFQSEHLLFSGPAVHLSTALAQEPGWDGEIHGSFQRPECCIIYIHNYIYMLLSDATIQFNGYLQMNILLVWTCFNITLLYIAAYGSNSASFAVLLWGFCWGCCRTWWHTSLRLSSNTVNSWQQCWQYW